jgi:hypothetical protein
MQINALIAQLVERSICNADVPCSNHGEGTKHMKLYEALIRANGREFKDRVGANSAEEARQLLQQRHGPRAVPYIPHQIPH